MSRSEGNLARQVDRIAFHRSTFPLCVSDGQESTLIPSRLESKYTMCQGCILYLNTQHISRCSQRSNKSDQGTLLFLLFLFQWSHINIDVSVEQCWHWYCRFASYRLVQTHTRFHPHEGVHELFRQPRIPVPVGERPVHAG
jgi:hypothetical protein